MKKLLILLLSTTILFATATSSSIEIFSKKINETFTYSSIPMIISTYELSIGENYRSITKREKHS